MNGTQRSTNSTQTPDVPETTKEKIARLFKPNTLARLELEGLMVIDKRDFQTHIDSYNAVKDENRALMLRIAQLEGGTNNEQV